MFSLVSALGIGLPLIMVMSVRYHHIYFLKKYKGLYNFGGNDQQSGIIVLSLNNNNKQVLSGWVK